MTLRDVLAAAGFSGAALDTAQAVATAESGGRPGAHNPNTATGDNSYGLFQINMIGAMGPARRAQYGLASNDALYDPATNARVAYAMSKGGTNWGPWSTFTSGAYKKFLGLNPAASSSTTTAANVGLLPTAGDLIANAGHIIIIGAAVAAGAALVLLGLNKAAGNPGTKAARLAANVAL